MKLIPLPEMCIRDDGEEINYLECIYINPEYVQSIEPKIGEETDACTIFMANRYGHVNIGMPIIECAKLLAPDN